ncbi:MAG: hypothetical protein UT89_C0006G0016 [Parcubacteria group bacterium GW2011_GWE1_40_20]|nr:MAG: hypothetical protein UT89_C0006G0016 [Parcubacteria group bacterium GW2011_GWE1_40_20]
MRIQKTITVKVTKITFGKDEFVYLTVHHPLSKNYPSLVFETNKFFQVKREMEKRT